MVSTATTSLIAQTLQLVPQEELLYPFCDHFLHSVPFRSLESFTPHNLAQFVQARYTFFKASVLEDTCFFNGVFRITEASREKVKNHVLEIVCPDANHIIVTLEALFKEFGCPITKMFHPIFSIERTETGLLSIQKASASRSLASFIYVEFEGAQDKKTVASLTDRISLHLRAIQFSFRSQQAISEKWIEIKNALSNSPVLQLPEPQEEWINLIDWLRTYNLSVYGYMAFSETVAHLETGLGILSQEYLTQDSVHLMAQLTEHNQKFLHYSHPFVFDTIPVKSPVQRFDNLMRLSLKIPNATGKVTEHIFLGLLKRSSLFVKNMETPLIHLKMAYIFEKKNMLPASYDYNEVIRLFTSIPKFELFRTDKEDLLQMVEAFLSITNQNEVYCFYSPKPQIFQGILYIVIPSFLFNKANVQVIKQFLNDTLSHTEMEVIEIRAEEKCRLHVHFRYDRGKAPQIDCSTIELQIKELIKPWEERVKDAILSDFEKSQSHALYHKYADAFPNHYKAIRTPADAVADIQFLERVDSTGSMAFSLTPFSYLDSALSGKASLLSLYSKKKIDLITVMPILQNLGLHVYDELTTSVGPQRESYGYIHSFRVAQANGKKIDEVLFEPLVGTLLSELFNDRTENDPLNALVLKTGMNWREVNLLQTYRNLSLQLSTAHTREKISQTLLRYPESAKALFAYFESKFSLNPALGEVEVRKAKVLPKAKQTFLESLHGVQEVAEDLIFKTFLNLMEASLRTNFYIPKTEDTFISIKLDSTQIKDIPLPVPYREIYVHDVGVEGTHLRFGAVARGGLRWSDRADDFRKEILGLVKTQQVKNVVIVPVGSKGGFVLKKQLTSKDMAASESVKQYRLFIKGLLDITDNINDQGQVIYPESVLIYDTQDPYLVVAADKGTANFSDIANDISEDYHFWLGDAFASGGSVGYNHKKEAITARGAWECTLLHFKELGKDILKESISVAGIGDMSGDVFGNGMLLSKLIQLKAAFNHAHIFIDPTPDPTASWEERNRLFDLPRSSWQDYSPSLISKGGGVFERKAKEIPLSEEMKLLLDVSTDTLTGEEVIKAILRMKVELLWFGGIGTYIKASYQTHAQVGDIANDAVRINADECRAKVIGEGANLGVTQLARIEFARRNGALNTDAIDNSAGVNMSDYEVNIKILLKRLLSDKVLPSVEKRNQVLEKATNEVSELVLYNNQGQHQLLSMDRIRSATQFQNFNTLIQDLISEGVLDAVTENIPNSVELDQLAAAKSMLSRPVLAVVQAYVKMEVFKKMVSAPELENSSLIPYYYAYFPQTIRDSFEVHFQKHHLKKEILATSLTNHIVNQAGMCFFSQVEALTGRSVGHIATGYLLLDSVLEGRVFREALQKETISQEVRYKALIAFETTLQTLLVSLLQLKIPISLDQEKAFLTVFSQLKKDTGHTSDLKHVQTKWIQKGLTSTTSHLLALLTELPLASDVIYLHQVLHLDIVAATQLVRQVNKVFKLDALYRAMVRLELSNHWDIAQKNSLLSQLQKYKKALYPVLLKEHPDAHKKWDKSEITTFFKNQYAAEFQLYLVTIEEILNSGMATLTSLSVGVNRLGFM